MPGNRFIIVAGKGGTGKTTVSAALALYFSRKGYSTLLASSSNTEKILSRLLGRKIQSSNTRVSENLWAVSIDTVESIKEYMLMALKLRYLINLLIGQNTIKSFITGIPGIHEWAVIGKVTWHLLESDGGKLVYDKVILDTPATGHSLSMIKIPLYISKVIKTGPMHEIALERLGILANHNITSVILTALPEEMAVTEALEMTEELQKELDILITGIVVNRILEPIFSDDEKEILMRNNIEGISAPVLEAARFRIMRENMQKKQLERLKGRFPVILLPELNVNSMDSAGLNILVNRLEETKLNFI